MTQGAKIGQLSLFFGADDLGSIMLEENVVAAAGVAVPHDPGATWSGPSARPVSTPRQRRTLYEPFRSRRQVVRPESSGVVEPGSAKLSTECLADDLELFLVLERVLPQDHLDAVNLLELSQKFAERPLEIMGDLGMDHQ